MTLKIAVLAPMPSASVKTATAVNFENLKNLLHHSANREADKKIPSER